MDLLHDPLQHPILCSIFTCPVKEPVLSGACRTDMPGLQSPRASS